VRTGCLISQRGRTDGAGAGLRGRNPDRNQFLDNWTNPSLSDFTAHQTLRGGSLKSLRTGCPSCGTRITDGPQLPQTNSTGFAIRGSKLW